MMSSGGIREGRRRPGPGELSTEVARYLGQQLPRPTGANQRARGLNPRAQGTNPRALGTNPNPRRAKSHRARTEAQEARRDDERAALALQVARRGEACRTCVTGRHPDCPTCRGYSELVVELCPCAGTGWVAAGAGTVRRCRHGCRPPLRRAL